jgi:hypothetical protein
MNLSILKTRNQISIEWSQWFLTAMVFLIAVGLRFAAISSDSLDYDTYSLMAGIDKGYDEYILNSFGIAQKTHYWLSYRLFGGTILSYRAIPAVLQFFAIIVLVVGVVKLWPQEQYMSATSLLLLAYNSHSLYVTSYPMVTYASDLFLGLVLFLYFVRISESEIVLSKVLLFSLLLFPFVIFSSVMVVVPLSVGVFSVLIWRAYLYRSGALPISALAELYRLWPLLYIPAVHFWIWWAFPFTNLGSGKRPDMHWLFFSQSSFSADIAGLFGFWLYNSGTLMRGLIKPEFSRLIFSGQALPYQYFAYAFFVGSVGFAMLYLLARQKVDARMKFSIIYFLTAYGAILVGGFGGMYPFGDVRYAGWLIGPVVIIIGYVFSRGLAELQRRAVKKLLPVLLVTVAASGVLYNIYYYNDRILERNSNYAAIKFIIQSAPEKYLISSYNQTVLSILAPRVFLNGLDIGWGTYYGNGSDGGATAPSFVLFTDSVENGDADSVTVVALSRTQFSELYPTWSNYLYRKYTLKHELHAPAMWIGEYALINGE